MIGVTKRTKRIFSKRQYTKKEVTSSLRDGNREWVTLLATVCADGSALPPAIIFQSANSTIQDLWVADIEAGKHNVLVTSSPSGWTNNDVGLAWLEQVFDRYTKDKARQRRSWRLLILDGHGSHLTQDFSTIAKLIVLCSPYLHLTQPIRFNRLTSSCSSHSLTPIPSTSLITSIKAKGCYQSRKVISSHCFGAPGLRSSVTMTLYSSHLKLLEYGLRTALLYSVASIKHRLTRVSVHHSPQTTGPGWSALYATLWQTRDQMRPKH